MARKPKVIVIVGPTASGKSAFAVRLAKTVNGEVVSADSRQVYRKLDVGSGKITRREMRGVPHHCIDIWNIGTRGNVSTFTQHGAKAIGRILSRGKVPIITGGSPLYVDALAYGALFPKVKPNRKKRDSLSRMKTEDIAKILRDLDAELWSTTDLHNPRRLIRAIEIAENAGKMPVTRMYPYNLLWIGLQPDKDSLRNKINSRLSRRMTPLEKEISRLIKNGARPARLRELGLEYRFGTDAHLGVMSTQECEEGLRKAIWGFARRQMTWWRRNREIQWFNPDNRNEMKRAMERVREFLV